MPPEPALPKRRRQILDDETGDMPRFGAGENVWAQPNAARKEYWGNDDAWVRNFMTRLAGLVRKVSNKN